VAVKARRFGRYELLEHLATGGMAEVWLARSFGVAGFQKRVVVKRILPGLARSPRFVRLFVQEARITAGLVHPNIVQIYELGRVGDDHYISMEFVHGRDLTRVIRTLRQRGERMPVPLALHVAAGVLRGLAHAHALTDPTGRRLRLVHRDVSPHNVMLSFQGEVKLFDFGIARLMGEAPSEPATGRAGGGKFAYMAPEQARGEPIDRRADIYSAGLVLFELLAGRRVFDQADPAEKLAAVQAGRVPDLAAIRPELPAAVVEAVAGMLAADPDARLPRAEEAEEAVRAALYDLGERADAATLAAWMRETCGEGVPARGPGVDVAGLVEEVKRLRLEASPAEQSEPSARSETTASGLDELKAAPGECKSVVVLAADVLGMTDPSARLDPEHVVRRHLRLLRRLRRSVERHGGTVDRFQDDSLVVFFGLPCTGEDDLDRALSCARDLQRQVARLERTGLAVRLAIGVHRGEVTLGRSRSRRLRYLSRGDTVKLARRLSLEADAGEVLVSEAVAELSRERWGLAEGPGLRARDGKEGSGTWRLGPRRPTATERQGRWVPRGDESTVLGAALGSLAEGAGGVLWIEGPAGHGKSRLLRELRTRARRHEVPLFAGRTTPYGRDRPLAPFRDVVAEALGIEPAATPRAIRARLQALSQLGLGPRERRMLGGLFAVDIGTRAPRGQPGQIADAAVAFVRGLSAERPLLMALEDVQHLESDERALLARVIESCVDRPVVFILTSRGAPGSWLPTPRWTVRLERLDPGRSAAVAADAIGARSVGPGLRGVISRTCEGNPLYAEAVAQALEAGGRLEWQGGVVELRDRETPPSLPPGLDGLIAARVDALPPRSKAALQVGATIGPRFHPSLLTAATGSEDIDALLQELERHHLLRREDDGVCCFVSSLVWETVRRSILAARQRECHGMVAHGIATLHRDDMDGHRFLLARHLARAGRSRDAADQAARAAVRLEEQQLVHEAARTWAAAVRWLGADEAAPPPPGEEAWMRLRAGETFALAGEPRSAEVHLQVALDLAEEALLPEAEARAQLGLGLLARGRGQAQRARRHLEAAWQVVAPRVADRPGSGWERDVAVRASEALGRLLHEAGEHRRAQDRFEEARRLADGDPALEARALAALALQPIRAGAAADALRLLEAARSAAESGGDRILLGKVVNNIGAVHHGAGRYGEALACFREALDVRQGLGYREGVVTNLHNVGDTLLRMEEVSRAWASFSHARELAREVGWARGEAMNDVYLAYIDGTRGVEGAVRRLQAARGRAESLADKETAAQAAWLLGRLLLSRGDSGSARDQLERARSEAEALAADLLLRDIGRDLGHLDTAGPS
jgi:class 3 adenylate cyclase/tetratricopeptide (TPR) repeat protein